MTVYDLNRKSRSETIGKYEFSVGQDLDGFTVSMPHQCDEWHVTAYYESVPRADAIAAMERFIAEATAALDVLRSTPDLIAERHPTDLQPNPDTTDLRPLRCARTWPDGTRCETYSHDGLGASECVRAVRAPA